MEIRDAADARVPERTPDEEMHDKRFTLLRAAEAKDEVRETPAFDADAFGRIAALSGGATFEQMNAYRQAAFNAGRPVTAEQIVTRMRALERGIVAPPRQAKTDRERFYALPLPTPAASFAEYEKYAKAAVAVGLKVDPGDLRRFAKRASEAGIETNSGRAQQLIADYIRESARGTLTGTHAVIGRALAEQRPDIARIVAFDRESDADILGWRRVAETLAQGVREQDGLEAQPPVDRPTTASAVVDRAVIGADVDRVARGLAPAVVPDQLTIERWSAGADTRFERLRAAEQMPVKRPGPLTRRVKRVPFESIPVPPLGASFEALDAYRVAANNAGVKVTAADLAAYEKAACDLALKPSALTIGQDVGLIVNEPQTPVAVAKMLVALAKQEPARKHIETMRNAYDKDTGVDRIEAIGKGLLTPEMRAERVTGDIAAFTEKRDRLANLPPLEPNATRETYERYRNAMRAVGIPFERRDYLLYRAAIEAPRPADRSLKMNEQLPIGMQLASGNSQVPLSLVVLDELRHPANERRLLVAGPHEFADALREHVPLYNPQIAELGGDELTSVPPQSAQPEVEINELPIFFDAPPRVAPSAPSDDRFAELARLERRDGRLFGNPLAKDFADIHVPAADATVEELNTYRRSANRSGVRVTAADLKTFAALTTAHGSGGYPRVAALLANDSDFARAAIADPSMRRHIVKMATAQMQQNPDYRRDFAFEQQVVQRVNASNADPKASIDLIGQRPNLLQRSLGALANVEPFPADPKAGDVAYYRMALGAAGIPLTDSDVRDYHAAVADGGVAKVNLDAATSASPGFKALADLANPPGRRKLFDGAKGTDYLAKLEGLMSPPPPAQTLAPTALPYTRIVNGKPEAQTAGQFFKSEGPVTYDETNDTFRQPYGPGINEFRVSDVAARLGPDMSRDRLVTLVKSNADIRLVATPAGIEFKERPRQLEATRALAAPTKSAQKEFSHSRL